jgi:hypothetical protein
MVDEVMLTADIFQLKRPALWKYVDKFVACILNREFDQKTSFNEPAERNEKNATNLKRNWRNATKNRSK